MPNRLLKQSDFSATTTHDEGDVDKNIHDNYDKNITPRVKTFCRESEQRKLQSRVKNSRKQKWQPRKNATATVAKLVFSLHNDPRPPGR
jgi:hypothetical protein